MYVSNRNAILIKKKNDTVSLIVKKKNMIGLTGQQWLRNTVSIESTYKCLLSFRSLIRKRKYTKCVTALNEKNESDSRGLNYSLDSLLAHTGVESRGKNAALSPPLELTSTYRRPLSHEEETHYQRIYARTHNSTRELLEKSIAQLEYHQRGVMNDSDRQYQRHQEHSSIAFSSGMAAATAILTAISSTSRSTHILIPDDIYHGIPSLLHSSLLSPNITFTSIDMANLSAVETSLQEYSRKSDKIIVWIETPSNPHCRITDIAAVCRLAKTFHTNGTSNDITTVVDATWSPPSLTQPLLVSFRYNYDSLA